ncbi:hypothetical protein [Paracoccus saliphilus]|uniref:Uncharacterized protein n=1 Tax=Paracoccus saliphilus TaxID=405559 RepID=A0AA45W657_9RHOB|nr:hypothetical protein [Paracoccus saliphilus]WCR01597.1 hypothetical protein JHX88_11680 [Paracoccus saliphilus]SIS98894.1 hypothetical protein SAMN05421772_11180 [Paracoccus saliphilus]
MAKSTSLRKEKQPSTPAVSAERFEQLRLRLRGILQDRKEFLDKNGSVNDVTSALGLTPITGRSGPRSFY